MYTHKCPDCNGSGSTPFRQNGGRCYTCCGRGIVGPFDLNREYDKRGRKITLSDGRKVGDLLLIDVGDHLEWCNPVLAAAAELDVLVPEKDGWGWEVSQIASIDGLSPEVICSDPPF